MKHISDFYITDSMLKEAQAEKQEDGSTKYSFADGSYAIEHPREEIFKGMFSSYRKFTKYEPDGTHKEYAEKSEHWVAQTDVHSLPSLQKIINPDGSERDIAFSYHHSNQWNGNASEITVKENGVKEVYTLNVERYVYNFEGEDYYLTERNDGKGCTRQLFAMDENGHRDRGSLDFKLKNMIDPQNPNDRPMVTERMPDGTERTYKVDNLETATKMLACDGELPAEYKKFLASEKLSDGTVRIWDDNGYIAHEKIPHVVERTWENGVLKEEIFGEGDLKEKILCGADPEMIGYIKEILQKRYTFDTLPDGTVRTLYRGKVISENRPNGDYRVISSRRDGAGVWYTSYPNGKRMFEWTSKDEYKKWNKDGTLQQKAGGGFTYYYENGQMKSIEGPDGMYFVKENTEHGRFKAALEAGDVREAESCLREICLRATRRGRSLESRCDGVSLMVRNSLNHTQMKILDDGLVAFGAVFENRHWVEEKMLGGGIEWYWCAAAVLLDVEKGNVVASCNTDTINVRDRYDPRRDKWKYIDTQDFMDFEDGKLTVRLGSYTSGEARVDLERYNMIVEELSKHAKTKEGMKKLKEHIDGKSYPLKKPGGRDD